MLLILSLSSGAFADAPVVFEVLDTDTNARAKALGIMLTASGDDVSSFLLNPAGLAFAPGAQIGITSNELLMDTSMLHGAFLFSMKHSGVGLSFTQYNGGTITVPGVNSVVNGNNMQVGVADDPSRGPVRVTAKSDQCLGLSFGREIMHGLSVGMTGKYITSTLLSQYASQAYAVDGGLLWKTPYRNIALGAGVYNMGTSIAYRDENEGLPSVARLGGIIPVCSARQYAWVIGGGMDWAMGRNDMAANLGSEFILSESLAVRGNYALGTYQPFLNPLSLGIGFMVGQSRIDYTLSDTTVEVIHQVSYTYNFGPSGNFGKGQKLYQKGQYEAARKQLLMVSASDPHYPKALSLVKLCDAGIDSKHFLDMSGTLKSNASKYPVTVKIMKYIPTAIYNLLPSRNIVPGTVSIKNNSTEDAEFIVKYKYDFQSDENVVRTEIYAGQEATVDLYPILPSPVGAQVTTQNVHSIRVKVYVGRANKHMKIMDDVNESVLFQPNNQYFAWIKNASGETTNLSDTLAAWVTPNDPAMTAVLARAGERAAKEQITIAGGQDSRIFMKSAEQVDKDISRQIEVIYNTLREDYNTSYLNQPILDIRNDLFSSQRVKYPVDTLQNKGNCIELSVLFASLLESIGINPVIMLMPNDGHCIVGWEVPGTDRTMSRLLETNQFGKDFETATKSSIVWLQKYGLEEMFNKGIPFNEKGIYEDDNITVLDVGAVRKRIPSSLYMARKQALQK